MKKVLFLAMLTLLSLSSCVTKKAFLELATEKSVMESDYLDSVAILHQHLDVWRDTVSALRLNLAERKGENNILISLRKELLARIDELEMDIEMKSNQSVSSQRSTKQKLAQKDNIIRSLQNQLVQVNEAIQKYQNRLAAFAGDVSMELQGYNDQLAYVSSKSDKVLVVLSSNSLLFKRPNSTTLSKSGMSLVQKMSKVVKNYPDLEIFVVGHTDNKTPAKSYKDNWYFSTLRAVSVVREMTQVNDVNNNQVSAMGRAEYVPIASNESTSGRNQNQRIEIVARPLTKNMIRDVKAVIK